VTSNKTSLPLLRLFRLFFSQSFPPFFACSEPPNACFLSAMTEVVPCVARTLQTRFSALICPYLPRGDPAPLTARQFLFGEPIITPPLFWRPSHDFFLWVRPFSPLPFFFRGPVFDFTLSKQTFYRPIPFTEVGSLLFPLTLRNATPTRLLGSPALFPLYERVNAFPSGNCPLHRPPFPSDFPSSSHFPAPHFYDFASEDYTDVNQFL